MTATDGGQEHGLGEDAAQANQINLFKQIVNERLDGGIVQAIDGAVHDASLLLPGAFLGLFVRGMLLGFLAFFSFFFGGSGSSSFQSASLGGRQVHAIRHDI